jgi:hypothetical protein
LPTDPIAAAISPELLRAEALIDEQIGWNDALRAVLGLFGDPDAPVAHAVMLPVEPNWAFRLPGTADTLPAPFVLHAFADALADTRPPWIAQWRHANGANLLGAAFLCEAWVSSAYADYQYGDLRKVPAMAEREARLLIAADIHGRLYELKRIRGQQPTLTVTDTPTQRQREANIPAAVYQLVGALQVN